MESQENNSVTLTFYPKDMKGKPLGHQVTITGSGDKVYEEWTKHNGEGVDFTKLKKPKTKDGQKNRKNNRNRKEAIPTGVTLEGLVKESVAYAKKKKESVDNAKNV